MRPLRELIFLSILLGFGIALQAIEAVYLPPLIIPGLKLGIANSITLIIIIFFSPRDAIEHILLRVTAAAFITGTFMSTQFIYSFAGGLTATVMMIFWRRCFYGFFSYAGISLIGALTHNLTQLALAAFIMGHLGIAMFLPWLILAATMTGTANGVLVNVVVKRLEIGDWRI